MSLSAERVTDLLDQARSIIGSSHYLKTSDQLIVEIAKLLQRERHHDEIAQQLVDIEMVLSTLK